MASAEVFGGGIGALCCAALLRRKGWNVTLSLPPKTQSPTVVLNPVTIQIIHEIFGDANYVLRNAQPISRHYINWGDNRPDEYTPSSGFTLTADLLSSRVLDLLKQDSQLIIDNTGSEPSEGTFDWQVYAMNTGRTETPARRFGERCAISVDVTLHDDSDNATSFIEATPGGWLFLAPVAPGRAVLQAVVPEKSSEIGATVRALLDHTKEIKRVVKDFEGDPFVVNCAPKKLSRMDGPNWLATGTAAFSYDPLCGDGTGYALRAAILAAAVLDGIDRGTTKESLISYYKLRLTYAFYTHLRSCVSLYSSASFNEIWHRDLNVTTEGLREVEQELAGMSTNHYRLNEFELLPMSA